MRALSVQQEVVRAADQAAGYIEDLENRVLVLERELQDVASELAKLRDGFKTG